MTDLAVVEGVRREWERQLLNSHALSSEVAIPKRELHYMLEFIGEVLESEYALQLRSSGANGLGGRDVEGGVSARRAGRDAYTGWCV